MGGLRLSDGIFRAVWQNGADLALTGGGESLFQQTQSFLDQG